MKLRQLLGMHTAMAVAVGIGWTLIVPYFLSLGYTKFDVMLYFLSFFAFAIFWLGTVRNWKIKNYLMFGLGMRALCFLAVITIVHPIQLMFIGIMFSFIMTDYWAVYNTLIEDRTVKGNRAFINSVVMAIIPVVFVITPVIAGFVADNHGFTGLFIAGFLLMLIPVYIASKAGEKRMLVDLHRADRNNKGLRELMFFEGFADGAGWAIPMFVTLQFVSSNLEFGSFFSYLALVGVVSALVLGKRSDKTGKRTRYIVPVMILNGLTLIVAGFANSLFVWAVALGVRSFFVRIEWPFTWAMVTDSAKGIGDAMIAREFWLNTGRVSILLIATFSLWYIDNLQIALAIGGLGYLVFPVFMKIRGFL